MVEARKIINSSRYGLEACVFTESEDTIGYLSRNLNVGTVNFNHVPLVSDDMLPVSGRNRCAKVLKGSKHCFGSYSKFKSINIHRF